MIKEIAKSREYFESETFLVVSIWLIQSLLVSLALTKCSVAYIINDLFSNKDYFDRT